MDKHAALFHKGRAGGVAVGGMTELWFRHFKNQQIVLNLTGLDVDADRGELLAILVSRGEPNLVVPYHGG
jgi:hypothetical protein